MYPKVSVFVPTSPSLRSPYVLSVKAISAAAEANLMEGPEMEALFESTEQKLEEQEEEEETEEEEEEDDDDDDDDEGTPPKKKPVLPLFKLKAKLEGHLAKLPVTGFNSGKYDINALKAFLMPILMDDLKFTIKKTNTFMCLSSERPRFLDILSFLAPGFSYAKFLKAYGYPQTKGFFPYEWFDSLDKLEQTCLPPPEAFHSTLHNEDISEEDYAYCQRVWQEHNMQTMRDFLERYKNLDVEPFCGAIQKISDFWKEKNIDMLKQGISIPGVTFIYLFATLPPDNFSLCSVKRTKTCIMPYGIIWWAAQASSFTATTRRERPRSVRWRWRRLDETPSHVKESWATTLILSVCGVSCRRYPPDTMIVGVQRPGFAKNTNAPPKKPRSGWSG